MSSAAVTFSVSTIDPIRHPAWTALLNHPAATLFHSPEWLGAISDAYGFKMHGLLLSSDSSSDAYALGGLPFCEIHDPAGDRIVSAPFCDTSDPLVHSQEAWETLFTHLRSFGLPIHLRCLGEQRVRIEKASCEASQVVVVKRTRWHRLSLDAPLPELWNRVAPDTRRAIRKARESGLHVRSISGEQDGASFHGLHLLLRKRKYRLLAQPRHFFASIEDRFRAIDGWHALGAFLGDRMIAATIYLKWGDTLYYKFNASALDALSNRPNNLLAWEGMQLAKSLGCRFLDFGPSDDDQPGLIRFKRNLGAAVQELRCLRWTPPGWQERPHGRAILAEMSRNLTSPEVPDEITAQAGAALYPFFA
jgi:CelD/BcsL family acetyltransferase involved in cellulose biosynthesis